MPRSPDSTIPPGTPERTLGWGVLEWCTKYIRQPDGDHAGERWVFTPAQVRFVLWFYAVDADGRWVHHRGTLRWSKGAGKSPFVAALALAELCGPVRFDRFDDRGPIGKPVAMPWVQIAATALEQTTNTMSMVTAMAPKGSRVVRDHGLDVGKEKIYRAGGGRLEIITASAHAAEGARATFAVADETEWWLSSNGGHALDAVIRRNLAKTGGRLLETCNAFIPGQYSVAERSHEAWQAQVEGRTRRGAMLYDAIELAPDVDVNDPDALAAGLLAGPYADAPWVDIERLVTEWYDPSTSPDVARRMYGNQIVAANDSWTTPQDWALLTDTDRVVADGEEIVLFFDGSKSRDATALIGCCVSDGHVFPVGIWEPQGRDELVPVAEVDARVDAAFERWSPLAFFADVKEWESFARISWPERYADRLLIWAVPSSKEPQPIAWDMRARDYDFTIAAETALAEIEQRKFTHTGDAALARHVGNARKRHSRYGVSVGKETKDSPRKIDAAVAMIGARMTRRLLLASKEFQKRAHRSTGRGRVIVFAD